MLYFGHAPMEGAGSAIIVLRHLRRLAESGWKIYVVSDWGQATVTCEREEWPVFFLPHRKFWWPPFNPDNPVLLAIRLWLWAGVCYKFIGSIKPDATFTYLSAFSDLLSQVAVGFSRRYHVPLTVIIHDNPEHFCSTPQAVTKVRMHYNRVISNAHQNWFASPQLSEIFSQSDNRNSFLPPIPEGWTGKSEWKPAYAERPLLAYAGNLREVQFSLLGKISEETEAVGGRLLLMVKKTPALESFCQKYPVEWKEPYNENKNALDYISQKAAALLVSYTESSEKMPWIKSSFPSKLVEYSHLGIPIIIMTPADSAVAIWANERQFPDSIPPDDLEGLCRFLESIKSKAQWEEKAAISQRYAASDFDPESIQKNFESHLTV